MTLECRKCGHLGVCGQTAGWVNVDDEPVHGKPVTMGTCVHCNLEDARKLETMADELFPGHESPWRPY